MMNKKEDMTPTERIIERALELNKSHVENLEQAMVSHVKRLIDEQKNKGDNHEV